MTSKKRLTLLACCFSLFMVTLDLTIVNVALPHIQRSFGAGLSGLQWIVDAYTLVLASLLLMSGSVGDRIGRKKVFQAGLVLFSAGSLLCSLAPSLIALVVFRMVQAVGGSMLTPASLSIITNVFEEPKERAGAIGIWAGVSGLSIAAGPVLGGLLVDFVGWRSIFWVNIPIGLVALVMTARHISESRADNPRQTDVPGQFLAIIFLALLTYALIEGPTYGWGSGTIDGLLAGAAASLAAFLAVERRVPEPLLELSFFRSPTFSGSAVIAAISFTAFVGFVFFNTLYLQEVRGYSALLAGLATLPCTAAIIFVSPVSGVVTGRRGPRLPITAAGVLLTAGLLVLLATTPTVPIGILFIGYVLIGVAIGLINPPITNAAVSGMPSEQAGVASAITSAARQVGAVFGIALIGSVVTSHFRSALPTHLAPLHLPAAIQHSVVATASAGAGAAPASGSGALFDAIAHAVGTAFTGALHWGYVLGAALALLATVVGAATMGRVRAPHVKEEAALVLGEQRGEEGAGGPALPTVGD